MSVNIYIYLIFFCFPLIFSSGRAIIYSTSAVLILCLGWFFLAAFSGLPTSESMLFGPFAYLAAIVAGGLVRLLTSRLAKPREKPAYFAGIAVAGFALSLILVNGPSATYQWATSKSLDQCRAASFPVTIGTRTLNVPGQLLGKDPAASGMTMFIHDRESMPISFQQWCTAMMGETITGNDIKLTINFRTDGDAYECGAPENEQVAAICKIHRVWRNHDIDGHMSAVIFSRNWDYPELRTYVVGSRPANYPDVLNTDYALNCTPNRVSSQCEACGTMGSGLLYVIDFRAPRGAQTAEGLRNLNVIKDVLNTLGARPEKAGARRDLN